MKISRSALIYALVVGSVLLLAIIGRILDFQALLRLRHLTFDVYQQLLPRKYDPKLPVSVVTIDEAALRVHGQWPWPRTVMAKLVDALRTYGAAAIGMDLVFAEPDRLSPEQVAKLWAQTSGRGDLPAALASYPSHDKIFAESIAKAPLVLGFIGSHSGGGNLPIQKTGIVFLGKRPHDFVATFPTATTSLVQFQEKARGTGALNWIPEQDQIIRKLPMVIRVGEQLYPALSIELLRVAQGAHSPLIRSAEGAGRGLVSLSVGAFTIPLNPDGTVWLRPRRIRADELISARDVLAGTVAPEKIRGRIVLIGAHAAGLGDIYATALQEAVAGVAVHAQILEQILTQDFLKRPDFILGLELAYMLGIGALLAWFLYKFNARMSALLALAAIVLALWAGWWAFRQGGWLIDSVYPVLVLVAVYVTGTLVRYRQTERERSQIRDAFSHYLAPQYVSRLMQNPEELKLGGETRDLTVMFCDVRGFTTLSETMDAGALNHFVNRLFSPLAKTIMAHDGTIDKFIGDAVMAFWNAPFDIADHPAKAAKAALAMLEDVKRLNEELAAEQDIKGGERHTAPALPRVRIGIGINRGPCCVGNLGSKERFDYSAIGDSVNIASRVESLTKTYGVDVLVTESVARAAPDYALLEIDEVQVKGRQQHVRLFALLGDETEKGSEEFRALQRAHENMIRAYKAGDRKRAKALLAECKARNYVGLDAVYALYTERLA